MNWQRLVSLCQMTTARCEFEHGVNYLLKSVIWCRSIWHLSDDIWTLFCLFTRGHWFYHAKYLFCFFETFQLSKATSRITEPIQGMFVLICMHFPRWLQIIMVMKFNKFDMFDNFMKFWTCRLLIHKTQIIWQSSFWWWKTSYTELNLYRCVNTSIHIGCFLSW